MSSFVRCDPLATNIMGPEIVTAPDVPTAVRSIINVVARNTIGAGSTYDSRPILHSHHDPGPHFISLPKPIHTTHAREG